MTNAARTMHRFNLRDSYCVRCGASKESIEDGFVNALCSGKPVHGGLWATLLTLWRRRSTNKGTGT